MSMSTLASSAAYSTCIPVRPPRLNAALSCQGLARPLHGRQSVAAAGAVAAAADFVGTGDTADLAAAGLESGRGVAVCTSTSLTGSGAAGS